MDPDRKELAAGLVPGPESRAGPAADDALSQLVERYGGPLRRFLRRRLGDADEADDALQETYIRLARYRTSGPIRSLKALAFRVASTVVIDRHRRRTSHLADAHDTLTDSEIRSVGASPERVVGAREELDLLAEAIAELPPKRRQVLLMSRLHGLKRQEIATRLGISVSMVDKHLGLAMAHCRRKVEGEAAKTSKSVESGPTAGPRAAAAARRDPEPTE